MNQLLTLKSVMVLTALAAGCGDHPYPSGPECSWNAVTRLKVIRDENSAESCDLRVTATWANDSSPLELRCTAGEGDVQCSCGAIRSERTSRMISDVVVEDPATDEVLFRGEPLFTQSCQLAVVIFPHAVPAGGSAN